MVPKKQIRVKEMERKRMVIKMKKRRARRKNSTDNKTTETIMETLI